MKRSILMYSPANITLSAHDKCDIFTDKPKDTRSWKLASERFATMSNGAHIQSCAEDRPFEASKGVDRYPLRAFHRPL